jgi:hypothetical protein
MLAGVPVPWYCERDVTERRLATQLRRSARAVLTWIRENWLPLTLVALSCAVILPISLRPGWPVDHDVGPLFERVEAFRRELAAGNLFPLWTPFCFNGHGSPMPFLYHRLFNTVAGLLALVFGTLGGLERAIVLSFVVGALGMAAAARELGGSPGIRLWSGAILPIAHYTFVNWLIRGSAAELTAGMLVPWLICACLRLLSGKTFGVRMGVALVLLFYAHIVVFLYSLPLLVIAAVAHLVARSGERGRAAKQLGRGAAVAGAFVLVGVGPYAAGVQLIGQREFNLKALGIYLPQNQLVDFSRYFVDNFPWGQRWEGFSVEIGRFLIAALVVAGVVVIARRARIAARPFAFLIAGAIAYLALQLPFAGNLYAAIPIAQIIQFPWRLLVFITPLVILALAVLARSIFELGGRWSYLAVGLLAGTWAAQASFTMAAYRADYAWLTPEALQARLDQLDGPFAAGEFLPQRLAARPLPARAPLFRFDGCRLASSSVDLARLETVPFETVHLMLESASGCTVHFSQFMTALIAVRPSAGGQVRRADDETTDVVFPPGPAQLTVERRGLLRALGHAIRNR